MIVKVNGKEQVFDSNQIELIELLKQNKVSKPELVSVQINGLFIKRENYPTTIIEENDEIEFLYFMGGGNNQ